LRISAEDGGRMKILLTNPDPVLDELRELGYSYPLT
jgi:hypothetical protein